MLGEEPPRTECIALADVEHVVADQPLHAPAQLVRIAQPQQRAPRELAADLLMALLRVPGLRVVVEPTVGATPRGVRLAGVVEQRREPHRERPARIGRCLDDGERVLVD